MNKLNLSPRLSVIAGFVEKGSRPADIGTDHGYIPVYLRQNDICQSVIASDINKGPLMSAVRSAEEYGVTSIDFICAPGLEGVRPNDADTVIIAGMGGETITEILKGAPWLDNGGVKLILQPQSKSDVLASYLHSRGMAVTNAKLVRDSGKLYVVIVCEKGESSRESFYFIEKLMERGDPLLPEYIQSLILKLEHRKTGLESSAKADLSELCWVKETLQKLRQYLEECGK